MTVSDALIVAESLKDFCKNVAEEAVSFGKNTKPVIELKMASNICTSLDIKNPARAFSSTLDLIKYDTTGEIVEVVQKGRG